jgi:hypothetical protein
MTTAQAAGIHRRAIQAMLERERARFAAANPRSRILAAAAMQGDLERAIHHMTPVCPVTPAADVRSLIEVLSKCLDELLS